MVIILCLFPLLAPLTTIQAEAEPLVFLVTSDWHIGETEVDAYGQTSTNRALALMQNITAAGWNYSFIQICGDVITNVGESYLQTYNETFKFGYENDTFYETRGNHDGNGTRGLNDWYTYTQRELCYTYTIRNITFVNLGISYYYVPPSVFSYDLNKTWIAQAFDGERHQTYWLQTHHCDVYAQPNYTYFQDTKLRDFLLEQHLIGWSHGHDHALPNNETDFSNGYVDIDVEPLSLLWNDYNTTIPFERVKIYYDRITVERWNAMTMTMTHIETYCLSTGLDGVYLPTPSPTATPSPNSTLILSPSSNPSSSPSPTPTPTPTYIPTPPPEETPLLFYGLATTGAFAAIGTAILLNKKGKNGKPRGPRPNV